MKMWSLRRHVAKTHVGLHKALVKAFNVLSRVERCEGAHWSGIIGYEPANSVVIARLGLLRVEHS